MAKRKQTRHYTLAAVAVLVIAGGIGAAYFQRSADPYRTAPQLPMEDYAENSLGLIGNRYKIRGDVASLLLWDAAAGRLVAIDTQQGPIGVLFPATLSITNIQKGQKLVMLGEVASNGVVKIIEFQKQ